MYCMQFIFQHSLFCYDIEKWNDDLNKKKIKIVLLSNKGSSTWEKNLSSIYLQWKKQKQKIHIIVIFLYPGICIN